MSVWLWVNPNDEFMTFEQFVQEYVCQKGLYSNQQVQQWLRKYNLSMDSRVIFVQTGWFEGAVRILNGYLLPTSGRVRRYLFISNIKRPNITEGIYI